jgi:general stress protein YciG
MAGTKIGGQRAAAKNLAKNPNFYKVIGAKGGANGHSGGFAKDTICDGSCGLNHHLGGNHRKSQCAGFKGGEKSRRRKVTA